MPTTLKEFRRRVLVRLKDESGMAYLAATEAINDAHAIIAAVHDFDELMTLDTANAETVANQQDYILGNDWPLTRVKQIYTMRYMDEELSRKLVWVPFQSLDEVVPYPERVGTGPPYWYTRQGLRISLFRIPDANKSVYIRHSMWPATLANETDETPYINLDFVITQLASEMAIGILTQKANVDWERRAKELLGLATKNDKNRPDQVLIAQPFDAETYCSRVTGEYWKDPFIDRNP